MLDAANLMEIHEVLTDWFSTDADPISPPGVKSNDLLESAAARPSQTVDGKDAYPTIFDKSAALFHSLINNHAFHNGNKRTALVAAQVALAQHNFWLEGATDDEMYEFTRKAAAHEICEKREDELQTIAEWFENKSRKALKEEFPLKYHELKENLERFDYTLDPPEGDLIAVRKDGKEVERIKKEGIKGFRPYHSHYISGLRKRLGLTRENGVDSAIFYGNLGTSNTASEFIELRWEVMKKLAKT